MHNNAWKLAGGFVLLFTTLTIHAELVPLADAELSQAHAQASIELDLQIQTSIESITYEDNDGAPSGSDVGDGVAGVLGLKGVHLGSLKRPITADDFNSERPFSDNDLAIIDNLVIDVDNHEGMRINLERLGDAKGNGLDIVVQHLVLGNEDTSAGGLLIEDLSNFISDDQLAASNQLFGSQLVTVDDGLNTRGGNFIPLQAQIVTEQNSALTTAFSTGIELPTEDVTPIVGITALANATDMTINSAFALSIAKVAWVDDGGEFGLAGLLVYQGIDTDGDGIDDQVGPAQLTNLKMQTVAHTSSITGETVQAMHFSNIDFKADIAINSIYVGQPENSLGSLLIKGLDTSGTQVWMYSH